MASESFRMRIVTPVGLVFDEEVVSVTLPSSDGEIGILPDHASYCGVLGTGALTFSRHGKLTTERVVISEGFCRFNDNQLTILADLVDKPDEIDLSTLQEEKRQASVNIATLGSADPEWQLASTRLKRIEALEQLTKH